MVLRRNNPGQSDGPNVNFCAHMTISPDCRRNLRHDVISIFYSEGFHHPLVVRFLKCTVPYAGAAEQIDLNVPVCEMVFQIYCTQYSKCRAIGMSRDLNAIYSVLHQSVQRLPYAGCFVRIDKPRVYADF